MLTLTRILGVGMKLNRTDVGSLAAIACAALVAVGVTGLVAIGDRLDVHVERAPHVKHVDEGDDPVVGLDGGVRVVRAEGVGAPSSPQPLLYVDGLRMEGDRDAVLADIDPDEIDRVEVVKGEAAIRLFGEEAVGGVIQIFLKDIGSAHPGG
jgi:hypothetical protein